MTLLCPRQLPPPPLPPFHTTNGSPAIDGNVPTNQRPPRDNYAAEKRGRNLREGPVWARAQAAHTTSPLAYTNGGSFSFSVKIKSRAQIRRTGTGRAGGGEEGGPYPRSLTGISLLFAVDQLRAHTAARWCTREKDREH